MYKIYLFVNKRTKKNRALFFCVLFFLILSSCGIPTFLSLEEGENSETSYYEFNTSDNDDNSKTTNVKFNIVDDITQVVDTPSICYFYAICPSNLNISENTFNKSIINGFDNIYSHKIPGQRLNISNDDPYVLKKEIDDVDIKLYKFNYKFLNQDVLDQKALSYLATAYDSNFKYNDVYDANFQISYNSISKQFDLNEIDSIKIYKTIDDTSSYVEPINLSLVRYNDDNFINSEIKSTDLDYKCIDDVNNSSTYKVYVYAALTVEGEFTNIFWSNLHKVGEFDI